MTTSREFQARFQEVGAQDRRQLEDAGRLVEYQPSYGYSLSRVEGQEVAEHPWTDDHADVFGVLR